MEKNVTDRVQWFVSTCRNNGLKVTPQRLAIFRILSRSADHPSTDTVYRKVVREFPSISFDTVHRTLLTFSKLGVIEAVESYSGVRRYETDLYDHHHIHCVICGTIIDFCDEELDAIQVPERIADGFTVLGKRVSIRGICENCRKQNSEGTHQ